MKRIAHALATGTFGILAVACGGSAATSPNEDTVTSAVMSQTFGPWKDASNTFAPTSAGAAKWEALLASYELNFRRGNVSDKKNLSTSRKDGWLIFKFCNISEDGECATKGYKELHLRSENGGLTDLRWFTGSKDDLTESKFFRVESEPFLDYTVDINFNHAIQDADGTCLLGTMELPDFEDQDSVNGPFQGFYTAYQLDATIGTLDDLSLEPNSLSYPGIIDRSSTGVEAFSLCVDYEAEQLAAFGLPEGDLQLQSLSSSYTDYSNSSDIFIVFTVSPL